PDAVRAGRPRPPRPRAVPVSDGPGPDGPASDLEQDGVALPATAAEGRSSEASAATLQLERGVQGDAGSGHAERVPDGDGAAVEVGDLVGDAELGHRGQADGGEGLVQLEEVDVGDRLAGTLER